ncbi:709_t:CDS:1, partial [Paraglomus occultum]
EQHDFRDLVKSLKGRKGQDGVRIPTKITFLANAYSWSAWLLDVFTNLFKLKKDAEIKKEKNDNSGVLEIVKDKKSVE